MRFLRLALAAALALAVLSRPALVHANSGAGSAQLRTAKVALKVATGTNSLANFANPAGVNLTAGRLQSDSLVVIDWIAYTAKAGAAAEDWTMAVVDDASATFFEIGETVAANIKDNFYHQFPTGLPMFNTSTASNVTTTGTTPCSSGYLVSVTGPTASGKLTIGWHYEKAADRQR